MYIICGEIIFTRKLFYGNAHRFEILFRRNLWWMGYTKCGDMISTHKLFDEMPNMDIILLSSLIDGHVKSMLEYDKALVVFDRMQS